MAGVLLFLAVNIFGQEQKIKEGAWMHSTALMLGVVWPFAEGYIHGLMFTNENPKGYPLGIKVDQDNKHLLYTAHRGAALGGAISLVMWRPPVKYFFTPRGAARAAGAWCVWTTVFNATVRKVQTDHYFPKNNQVHGYDLEIMGVRIRFKEPAASVRKAQLIAGVAIYFLPDIVDLIKGKEKKNNPAPDLLAEKNFFAINFSPDVSLARGEKFYGGKIMIKF